MDSIYVVTDVEVDGPVPGENSMLSFASVAVDHFGVIIDAFEAVLVPLEDAVSDPATIAWLKSQPLVLAAATENASPPGDVIPRFVQWVRTLPGEPIFTAHPLQMDAPWLDFYLRRFAGIRLLKGPWIGERLFYEGGFCLRSFASGRLGWPLRQTGYAHLLGHLMKKSVS
jgi:hypothetical protein